MSYNNWYFAASIGNLPPLLVLAASIGTAASIGNMPPLLVQRCNGTTARLGLLEVRWVAHVKIPHQAVSL